MMKLVVARGTIELWPRVLARDLGRVLLGSLQGSHLHNWMKLVRFVGGWVDFADAPDSLERGGQVAPADSSVIGGLGGLGFGEPVGLVAGGMSGILTEFGMLPNNPFRCFSMLFW